MIFYGNVTITVVHFITITATPTPIQPVGQYAIALEGQSL
jgi:hypothetical protein